MSVKNLFIELVGNYDTIEGRLKTNLTTEFFLVI